MKFFKKINWNKILFIFMILLVFIFLGFLLFANILPIKYLVLIILLLALYLAGLYFLLVFKTKKGMNKKRKIPGYILSVLLIVLLSVVSYYLNSTLGFFSGFGNNRYKEESYLVLVLKNSKYEKIEDLDNSTIGYVPNELSTIKEAIGKLDKVIKIENKEYEQYDTIFDDLTDELVDSILIEESYFEMLNEKKDYTSLVRTLYTINIKTEINISKSTDVTKNTFSIYISGIDQYGKIANVSRSDVNIVATINPKTKQILLISVPRDYYVQLRGTTGYKDKLTHAGVYGIDTSVGTLEDLLETDINYYFRVNFTSLEKIVDALGGVDVYSKYSFTSSVESGGTYRFTKGYNHLTGKQALSFSRERHNLSGGDRARGENQQAVIDGVVRKATSSAIITKYNTLLNSLKNTFQTNMTDDDIFKLIKMQLNDMSGWNITSYNLDGDNCGGYQYTYSTPKQKLDVMCPINDTIKQAKQLIDKVIVGEKLEASYADKPSDIKDPTPVAPPKVETPPPVETPAKEIKISIKEKKIIMLLGDNYDIMSGVSVNGDYKIEANYSDTTKFLVGTYNIIYKVTVDDKTVTETKTIIVLDPDGDEDKDGYTNKEEIDAKTDPFDKESYPNKPLDPPDEEPGDNEEDPSSGGDSNLGVLNP